METRMCSQTDCFRLLLIGRPNRVWGKESVRLSEIPALDTSGEPKNHHRRCFGETLRHVRLWAATHMIESYVIFKNFFRRGEDFLLTRS